MRLTKEQQVLVVEAMPIAERTARRWKRIWGDRLDLGDILGATYEELCRAAIAHEIKKPRAEWKTFALWRVRTALFRDAYIGLVLTQRKSGLAQGRSRKKITSRMADLSAVPEQGREHREYARAEARIDLARLKGRTQITEWQWESLCASIEPRGLGDLARTRGTSTACVSFLARVARTRLERASKHRVGDFRCR